MGSLQKKCLQEWKWDQLSSENTTVKKLFWVNDIFLVNKINEKLLKRLQNF